LTAMASHHFNIVTESIKLSRIERGARREAISFPYN
jgi:hypothetical protein